MDVNLTGIFYAKNDKKNYIYFILPFPIVTLFFITIQIVLYDYFPPKFLLLQHNY